MKGVEMKLRIKNITVDSVRRFRRRKSLDSKVWIEPKNITQLDPCKLKYTTKMKNVSLEYRDNKIKIKIGRKIETRFSYSCSIGFNNQFMNELNMDYMLN